MNSPFAGIDDKPINMAFMPLNGWCLTDDIYKYRVALYNTKEQCFYMGEVECDGIKLMVSYESPEYYGTEIEIITDYTNWYYIVIGDYPVTYDIKEDEEEC